MFLSLSVVPSSQELPSLRAAVIQPLHMMICAPSNYTSLILEEKERPREREQGGAGGGKKKKNPVILKSPLDAGLIIVCLVFAVAVIETLAARLSIYSTWADRARPVEGF